MPARSPEEICRLCVLEATKPPEFSLGHNVSSKEEVNAVMDQACKAVAVSVKPARDNFWGGYAGYFQVADHHLWEIVWDPAWEAKE